MSRPALWKRRWFRVAAALVLLLGIFRLVRKPLLLPKPPRPDAATFEQAWRSEPRHVPVFGVTFGADADRSQLDNLARLTGGRVFDGTKSLADAFRAVRGYN